MEVRWCLPLVYVALPQTLRLPVLAICGIDAFLTQAQAFYRLSANNVGVDDFIDVIERDTSVPDRLGINHEVWTMFALVETPGLVGSNPPSQTSFGKLLLEGLLQLCVSLRITTPAWMSRNPLVSADENVLLKCWHVDSVEAPAKTQKGLNAESGRLVFERDHHLVALAEGGDCL